MPKFFKITLTKTVEDVEVTHFVASLPSDVFDTIDIDEIIKED